MAMHMEMIRRRQKPHTGLAHLGCRGTQNKFWLKLKLTSLVFPTVFVSERRCKALCFPGEQGSCTSELREIAPAHQGSDPTR